MTFDIESLLLIGLSYLLLLFAIAYATERQLIPAAILNHPAIYVLSLGVTAGGLAVYGAVGLADQYGYSYLYYYVGISAGMMFLPVLLGPLYQISKAYRLSSLADLLSFRYNSQWVGSITTVLLLFCMAPLLAIQIQTVSESALILSNKRGELYGNVQAADIAAFLFCIIIVIFTILFGSRHLNARESHQGLVSALAFESLVKMTAIVLVAVIAVPAVFGDFGKMQLWLMEQPELLAGLGKINSEDTSRLMLVMFFAITVCMPHFFHMLFAESRSGQKLAAASWGLPLYLLIISLPILPILWAGQASGISTPPDYFALGLAQHLENPWLATLIFIGGLSAASGVIIVSTLAIASMCLNHLVLPLYQPKTDTDIYRWLLNTRKLLIGLIILFGYVFYNSVPERQSLANLAMISVTGCVQFLPGVLAVLYWPQGNRTGFIAGLATGFGVWMLGLLLPLFIGDPNILLAIFSTAFENNDKWFVIGSTSLATNLLVFIVVSLSTERSSGEQRAAESCTLDDLNRPSRQVLHLQNAKEMLLRLNNSLGESTAKQEFYRALEELNLHESETRPYALRRIRAHIEINLSALLGPSNAQRIIATALPYKRSNHAGEDITFIEERLEHYQTNLTGLAADLDGLRRYHRQTLENLPIGLCALGEDREILMWNTAIANITGISSGQITGSTITGLTTPWRDFLDEFCNSDDTHWSNRSIETSHGLRWLTMNKTVSQTSEQNEVILVIEDVTDTQLLEKKLTHQERLASIGRLAAGVAHEIGNPVTGIACLAQNLQHESDNPDTLESAAQIVKQTQRITSIVQSLVNFAHARHDTQNQHATDTISVHDNVSEAIQLLRLDSEATQVNYRNLCPPDIWVIGDNQRLMQVFINLLSNARDASDNNAAICVEAAIEESRAHITITDSGEGISEELSKQVFEPFFTTKDPGKGTGLGLALVYSIVDDLAGDIEIESPVAELDGIGTRFHIRLPLANKVITG